MFPAVHDWSLSESVELGSHLRTIQPIFIHKVDNVAFTCALQKQNP